MDIRGILSTIDAEAFYCDVIGELPTPDLNGEVGVKCLFHNDSDPSMRVNLNTGLFNCLACGVKGNVIQFYERLNSCSFTEAIEAVEKYATKERKEVTPPSSPPLIPRSVVEQYCKQLSEEWLVYLETERGITRETARFFDIGWDGGCITLPVCNEALETPNIRRFDPFAVKPQPKMRSYAKGYGQALVYPWPPKTEEKEILICEGEFDCLVARQLGFHAYTGTNGANSIPAALLETCDQKDVFIAYDSDDAGEEGSRKLALALIGRAKQTKILRLPVDKELGHKDITDWVVKEGATKEDFDNLIKDTPEFKPQIKKSSFDTETDVLTLVPKPSLVHDYITYCMTQTDAPPAFHLATALSIIAATVGNRCYLHSWGDAIYPNLWALLIAPSGFYRKTTAMNLGVNLLRSVPGGLLPDEFTPERLFCHLAEHPTGLLAVSEFGALLSKMSKDYMGGVKEFLTNLYDCPAELIKELQPKRPDDPPRIITIRQPALSILGCSTLDWMFDRIKDGDIKGGFLARFIYWPVASKPNWMGVTSNPYTNIKEALRAELLDRMSVAGRMTLDAGAESVYNDWNKSIADEACRRSSPAVMQGFYTRLTVAALKIAMIYQIAYDPNTRVVSEKNMEYALKTAEYLKGNLKHLLIEELVIGADQVDMKRIRGILEGYPQGATKAQLLRDSGMTLKRFNSIMETLQAAEYVAGNKDLYVGLHP